MPQMANVTVKAANGTTDVVYTALTPSAGDTVAAQWRQEDATRFAGLRDAVSFDTRYNGPRDARRFRIAFVFPYAVTDAQGKQTSDAKVPMEFTGVIPQNVPDSVISEAIARATAFLNSALAKDSLKAGYAPT